MYTPSAFSETDSEVLAEWIAQHPLGILVTAGASGLLATPVPFLYRRVDGVGSLMTHVAKANPQWRDVSEGMECLVVFQGVEGYVSPDWYATKKLTQKVVPTWNYEMVQARGWLRVVEDAEWLRRQVDELTELMEQPRSCPWKTNDAPGDFIDSLLGAIVGLEIRISGIKGKWKMSQNRSQEDVRGVAEGLADPLDPHCHVDMAQKVASYLIQD
jgi:transcriptional regulator